MKTVVYAICKDEAKRVAQFMESAREADGVYVLDTGSTDGSPDALRQAGATVTVQTFTPWRFDAARNAALATVPDDVDVCVICDLDERFPPGWRKKLETLWTPGLHRMQVRYVFAWKPDGSPDVVYFMTRVHARHGYTWTHPVHECLKWIGDGPEVAVDESRLELHHFQNRERSRAQYLPLLKLSVVEDPSDDRNSHYLGRELWYAGQYEDAIAELKRHLSLPRSQWLPERAASMSYIAQASDMLGRKGDAEAWYLRACAEYDDRDHWVRLGMFYLWAKNYAGAYAAALRGLRQTTRALTYLSDASSWGALPHDIAATAAFYLGLHGAAVQHYEDAAKLAPGDTRIAGDLELCRQLLRKAG
jgi:glycosyltransferase involved in cell wall biosynthesis